MESTTLMDVDTMAVTEQTTAMDKMAGAFSGGKCTILVNDVSLKSPIHHNNVVVPGLYCWRSLQTLLKLCLLFVYAWFC